jgi:CheY-like chemotaxis protein/two-component sensor histidine kinase
MAEAENRAKDDFLAVLAHELRTPMMPITMAVGALHARMPDVPEVARTRDVVDRQVRRLTRLVDDLLDMSRLTRSNLQLSLERLDLRPNVADAIETTRPQLDARHHRITLQQSDTPVWIDGDAVRLGQVAVNLLANAAKFTPPEGQITVSVATEGRDAVLRVRDNGVGIGPDTLPQIFEPFTQGAHAVAASERGLGIGLALVRGLVEAHGGAVTASSAGHNRGSEFVVRLPLSSAPARTTTPRSEDAQATASARILIVEDHADSRAMLAEMLGFEGHEVVAVADGTQALATALASPPDVAIIDIGLHGMDGHEVARRLRQAHGPSVLLIAVTGYGQAEDIEQSREAGFDAHVTKPVLPDELLELIRRRPRR